MVKVENKDTLRLLTKRFMKMNRGRNVVAVLAILLTSLLFTSLFMGSVSLILSKRATDVKQYMSSSHAVAQDLTIKEQVKAAEAMLNDDDIERFGLGTFLGSGIDKRLSFSTEVRSGDNNFAESFNCLPTTGRLPQSKDEIAVSTLVLDALGIPHEPGTEVTLTYEINPLLQELKTDTFKLCGYWEGDKAVLSQMIWVSEDYAEENSFHPTKKDIENGIVNGGKDCVLWYKNLWFLESKTEKLQKNAGFTEVGTGFEVNPAYNLMEEDSFSFSSVVVAVFLILLAGYLIIYNIFSISVKTDIRAYGLLKNVGTTGKQLKHIVRLQAWCLSAVGIPLGLILGYGAGILMAPTLTQDVQISADAEQTAVTVISANPLIFIAAGLFTLVTVYLSSLHACQMVEKVSPVEALRLSESDQTQKKIKKNTSVSWWGMAIQNMIRNWKKGLIVMLSIALSMVVVNCIVLLVRGYDFDAYKKIFLASDFQLDQMTSSLNNTNFHGITPDIRALLNDCPNAESTGYVYYSKEQHRMEPHLMDTWRKNAEKYNKNWSDYETKLWKDVQSSQTINLHFLGISQSIFEKLEWKDTACSWEDFKSGNYVIVDYNDQDSENPTSYYQTGETFHMDYQSGNTKDYTILGEAVMPYALDYPYSDLIYLTVLVPETEFITYTGEESAMYAAIDAKKNAEKEIKQYLDDKVLKNHNLLNVFSVLDMEESFQKYVSKFYTIGGYLVVILAFIGIMNFFNTTATSVLSRKKELALLEVVGMTKSQISKMLIAEGCIYLGGAFILAILIVYLFAGKLISHTIGLAFFFHLKLTVLPCLLIMPLLLIIAYAIPKYQFQRLNRESMVERIRNE